MGSARTYQNFTSVNEHAALDGVVYFFSFEFTKFLTLIERNANNQKPALFCGKRASYIADTTFC